MEMLDLNIPSTNKFATEYLQNKLENQLFFDYSLNDPDVFLNRIKEISLRHFPRERLVQHLLHYNKKFQCGPETIKNIERLLQPKSVVVIGGQQAGLLTGPLYTIHKIISIIQFARLQEKELNIPVLPVFWIAGEDHDFAEINHVYIQSDKKVKKKSYPEQHLEKKMISQLPICKPLCRKWFEEIFSTYGETQFTKKLLHMLENCLNISKSYTDFFAAIILKLFSEEGIIVIDSAEKELRDLEAEFFQQLIHKNEAIYAAVNAQQEVITSRNFPKSIEMIQGSVNLFYHINDERILLQKNNDQDSYCGKNGECNITMEDMIETAKFNPRQLSNNVVTRPLMQEYLFPTIAFISGPGEIAYWAELKQAFKLFGFKMPPILPRLNITILERPISSDLLDLEMDLTEVLSNGTEVMKREWLQKNIPFNIDEAIFHAQQDVERIHSELRNKAFEIDPNLKFILDKNAQLVMNQFNFMKHAIKKASFLKHEAQINKYYRVALSLRPNGAPQERIWNIFYYLNKYGEDFLPRITQLNYEFNGKHKVIQI